MRDKDELQTAIIFLFIFLVLPMLIVMWAAFDQASSGRRCVEAETTYGQSGPRTVCVEYYYGEDSP